MQLTLNVSHYRFCLILKSTRIQPYQFVILCDGLDGLELIGDGQLPSKARPNPPAEVRPHQDREAADVPLGLDGVGTESFDDDRFGVLEVVDVDANVVVDVERRREGVDEKLAIFAENQVLVEVHFEAKERHDMAILLFGEFYFQERGVAIPRSDDKLGMSDCSGMEQKIPCRTSMLKIL